LEYFEVTHDNKSYNLVHCWTELKYYRKWQLSYEAYKKSLKSGRGNDSTVIDLEDEGPPSDALHKRGNEASEAVLKRYASALAFGVTLKGLMAKKEDALAKGDKMRHRKKEATCASFIDLTKRALDIEESIACTKATRADAKLLHEENRIMLPDLSIMAREQKARFERKKPNTHERNA
jgi:hypothetical protein